MEEGVGFEPTRACALAVFKTAAIDQLGHPSTLQANSLAEDGTESSGVCYRICYRLAPPLTVGATGLTRR